MTVETRIERDPVQALPSGSAVMSETFRTLPGLLKYVETHFKNDCALGYRKAGKWESISTQQVGETVRQLCMGLVELGLKPNDKVGLVADPSPFWLMMDLAILGAGAVSVPMFANISHDNLQFEIRDSGMKFLFVGSEQQYLAMKPFFGAMAKIIVMPSGLGDSQCISYENLLVLGAKRQSQGGSEYLRLSEGINEQDSATLIYTSGSTGVPKGVELTHRNLVFQVMAANKRFPLNPSVDKILSCLPLAHVFERMVCYYYFFTGSSIYFAEDIKKVSEHLRDLHPTVITLVPRLLEKIHAKMQANLEVAQGFKKFIGTRAWKRAHEKLPGSKDTLTDKIFDSLVYSKMRQALGGSLRIAISGSAPLDAKLATFFLNVGIPVYEGYGLTEASPVIAANFPGHRKLGTVGLAFPGVEVKFADDGEILSRGPHVMKGYYNKPVETAEVIDKLGWLHTGDLGHFDAENYIKITGRKKELFKTANGKYVAPVPIEQAIAGCKLVDMVMVIAEGKPFTTALIFPDFENLDVVKLEAGCEAMGADAFLDSPQAKAYIQKSLEEVNSKLNHWEQVQKFSIIKTPITVDSGQLTPTMKIRRHIVMEKYRPEIDAMYRS
jgi:long-chain acyl-CoA synthetase